MPAFLLVLEKRIRLFFHTLQRSKFDPHQSPIHRTRISPLIEFFVVVKSEVARCYRRCCKGAHVV